MDPTEYFVEGVMSRTELVAVDEAQPMRGSDPPQRPRSRIDDEFTAFYRAEHDGQVRRAALLVGSDEVANDIVHDVLVEVLRRWDTISHHGSYLNRGVLNGCLDRVRNDKVVAVAHRRLAAGETSSTDDVLYDVIARLPFNHRAAVVMRFYERMTEQEIAEALGCKPGSVGPWIHRALTTMRKELS